MKKIAIIGSGGSGKSTLANQLGELLSIPVYHLDTLYWQPGWIPTSKREWTQIINRLISKKEWIIDGNYGGTMDMRLQNADAIIFLDYPTYLCTYRIIKRRFMYKNKTRPDMGKGCPEKLDFTFLRWVMGFRRKKRPGILKRLEKVKNEKSIYIFKTPKQTNDFLKQLHMRP